MNRFKLFSVLFLSTLALQSCGKVENAPGDFFKELQIEPVPATPVAKIQSDVDAYSINGKCTPGSRCRTGVTLKNIGSRTATGIRMECMYDFVSGYFSGVESSLNEAPIPAGETRSLSCSFYSSGKTYVNNVEFGWMSISYTTDDLGSRETVRVPVIY